MDLLRNKIPSHIWDRLIAANIDSLKTLLMLSETELQESTNLKTEDVQVIVREAAHIVVSSKFKQSSEIKEWQRISTGCGRINNITRGGIPINGITEIYGTSGVGKTQMCLQLSLMVQLPKCLGGCEKGCIYISTEDTFPSNRLHQLAKMSALKFDTNIKFEDNIFLEHIVDFEQLRRCIYTRLPYFLTQQNIGLLLIDSIAGIFRSENLDVNYTNRSKEFQMISTQLIKLSETFNLAVVCTNQVTENPNTSESEPCLGLSWTNLITSRFCLMRFVDTRVFNVVFAPDLPNKSCTFVIKDIGIVGTTNK